MTLELNEVANQVRSMGQSLGEHQRVRDESSEEADALLNQYATDFTTLHERITEAERVQQRQRFDWVGAAPTNETLNRAYPLPESPARVTVIASDGSQILPDTHGIMLYYLINIGSIIFRHGSNQKPHTYHPTPILKHGPETYDDNGTLISAGEVNVQRDLAEVQVLADLVPAYTELDEPVIALMDGQLTLRVIDLPFNQQGEKREEHVEMLNKLREAGAQVAAYVDRPRSTFVLSLLHLAALEPDAISEETLRSNRFRHLTDLDLFGFIPPGERSAIFAVRAKGMEKYEAAGHAVHFFYLNVSDVPEQPQLARVEIPAWVASDSAAVDLLHVVLVRQARITGGYPYVLARADELAVISPEEREAVEMMLAVAMRKQGLIPSVSRKQHSKNNFRFSRRKF